MGGGRVEFGAKLKAYRERAGMSQNALARASGLNPASINRLESGERSPSNRELVERICDALELEGPDRDDLLSTAGHLPNAYDLVSPSDPTLLTVARALGDPAVPPEDKAELRSIIEALCRRWSSPGSRQER